MAKTILLKDAKPGKRYRDAHSTNSYYVLNGSGIPGWPRAKGQNDVLACVNENPPANPRPVNGLIEVKA